MTKGYRFGSFELSLRSRTLTLAGLPVPLIPRYFDLLALLIARRHEAVHRRDIHRIVWSDVVVSDGALSQGIRILRRALGDVSREPAYIRTVSRHGYQFVFADVRVLGDDDADAGPAAVTAAPRPAPEPADRTARIEAALATLTGASPAPADGQSDAERRRDAAETLHALGTLEALARLGTRAGHQRARALLRDVRWEMAGAGDVPLLGTPGMLGTVAHLLRLRVARASEAAARRWASAALGGALAGLLSGAIGGTLLWLGPQSTAGPSVPLVLACIGAFIGGLGAAGIGAGIEAAEVAVRSNRRLAVVILGGLGGGIVGAAGHLVALVALQGVFGRDLSPVGGGIEGLGIGLGAAFGYALSTPRAGGGLAAPSGGARLRTMLVTGIFCALAAFLLAARGRYLGAMSLDLLAHAFAGSQVGLEPLARLLGEAEPGTRTRLLVSTGEGLMLGAGLAFGVTRRPR